MTLLSQIDLFHEQAAQVAGLNDFGPTEYIEPMKLLLSDYDNNPRLTPFAKMQITGHMTGLLVARLFAQEGFKKFPQFTDTPIEKPIIIVGMPRTGSTALHRLLASDPHSQCLVPWLGNTPMPRPDRDTWETNPWYQLTAQGLSQFYEAIPKVRQLHPQSAIEADECRFALEPSFWSPAIAFLGPVDQYGEWFVDADARYAYKHYRKVLGLIAGGDTRRWILKDPTTHLWMPERLLETFPDACLVYTHRDPVTAMTSISSMMYEVRSPRETNLSREEIGRVQLSLWGPAIAKTDRAIRQLESSRVCDVHIGELNRDPVATAERIYNYFNLPISRETRAAWQRFVADDPRSGHGAHHYHPEQFGFTAEEVHSITAPYYENYSSIYGAETV